MVGSTVTGEDGVLNWNLVRDVIEISAGMWDDWFDNTVGAVVAVVDEFVAVDSRRVKILVFLTILRPGTGGTIGLKVDREELGVDGTFNSVTSMLDLRIGSRSEMVMVCDDRFVKVALPSRSSFAAVSSIFGASDLPNSSLVFIDYRRRK